MEILKLDNLSKKYPNSRGVHNINLTIEHGQIWGFLGPNGSGKTTTLKLIMNIINKNSGSVQICGYDVEDEQENAIRNIGAMFESTVHYGELTAMQNMEQLARYYPEIDKSRIDEILEVVGLSKYKKEKVKGFSLGMRQRLSIAQAMYPNPKLLILDEPFNGLDIEGVVEIRNLITKMSTKDNISFLISSHMASEMEKMCTHIATIRDGILIDTDEVNNILNLYPSIEDYFITKFNEKEDI